MRSPGVCNVNDDNRVIAAAVSACDLLIYLTPITFGGYSSELKRMVDHQIQNVLPYFEEAENETHHQRRYSRYPDFLAVGWMDKANPYAEAVFRNLVYRNSLNFHARKSVCGLVIGRHSQAQIRQNAESWLQQLESSTDFPRPELPLPPNYSTTPALVPRRAVLLVGSPRTRKSTSNALGAYLMERLSAHGLETETIQVYTSLSNPEKMSLLLEKVGASDLVVLAFPLYVDTLPAPVISLLEQIAARRSGQTSHNSFAALVNCGFPETSHCTNVLAVCTEFARQTGTEWKGGLALGAGEGMIHGTPLNELDGRVIPLKNALDLAAEALAGGRPIPAQAKELLAKPFIPAWLYRLMGVIGWRQQAKRWGAVKMIKSKPYYKAN